MELVCTYIESENFEKTVEFYNKVLQIEPNEFCANRWVKFECSNKLSIYNRKYDEDKINNINYNEAYIKDFNKLKSEKKNNIVTFNFYTDNLKEEYTRIQNLDLGQVSKIMYVNIVEPYYYFNISDPDGNVLEICSDNYE